MQETIEFATDVATICIFDPERLKHHLNDVGDWWSIESQALEEINKGNAIFIDVSNDGYYTIHVHDGIVSSKNKVITAKTSCPSGQLYIGPGEMITGEGLEPDQDLGGSFISLNPGNYLISIAEYGNYEIEIGIENTLENPDNNFIDPIRIFN